MNDQLEIALERLRTLGGRYELSNRYYRGEHNLSFATDKFANTFGELFRAFALNLCPAIVDALADKLKVIGFGVDEGDPAAAARALGLWRAKRLATTAGEIHREALRNGDAYAILWPSPHDGRASVYANAADKCTVFYDEEEPGKVLWAAKMWSEEAGSLRVNLFFPDRIERYAAERSHGNASWDAAAFKPASPHIVKNTYGVVPVFHFANNSAPGGLGRSELESAIPIQDGMNKAVLDMLVAMEVCAYRQRWAAGIEIQYDKEGNAVAPFKAGIDHLWLAENPDARFGDFAAADLDQFLKVKEGFRIDLASVTGTPLYYLMPQVSGFPSGESLRKAETRFLAKVRDRQEQFGSVWAEIMSLALRMEGREAAQLNTKWEAASPVNEREMLENLLLKKQLGLTGKGLLAEAGYGNADLEQIPTEEERRNNERIN